MILFKERLKIVRETAIEYICNKVDEQEGEIQLSEHVRARKSDNRYWIHYKQHKSPIEIMPIEDLCTIADEIHTLPAKDLKK